MDWLSTAGRAWTGTVWQGRVEQGRLGEARLGKVRPSKDAAKQAWKKVRDFEFFLSGDSVPHLCCIEIVSIVFCCYLPG